MRYAFVIVAIIGLLILHQNYATWERDDLVFGFLPYQLAYDGTLSMVTALVWLVAVMICWPIDKRSRQQAEDDAKNRTEGQS